MIRFLLRAAPALFAAVFASCLPLAAQAACGGRPAPAPMRNFHVAVYITVGVVERMADADWLARSWQAISCNVHVDKVYIETFRSGETANEPLIERIKSFFQARGVATAGGIAFQGPTRAGQFHSLDYSDPQTREFVRHISALTARHFDEIILDDFFFSNSKTDADIAAKGDRSWTAFRLQMMDEVARDLVEGAAKAANPRVRVIVKFPNWYEHFQGLGYDLAQEPKIFDGIYTGTETRDPEITAQQLQPYESFEIFRYFSNIAPGRNRGGWVDTYGTRYLDRYAEQLWDTVFAKAPEITLFNWADLLRPAAPGARAAWQTLPTSFNYGALLHQAFAPPPASPSGRFNPPPPSAAAAAGYALAVADPVVGELGEPIGLAVYKPLQSDGEDFLPNYLGMLGLPLDLTPSFPDSLSPGDTILLAQSAAADPRLVPEMESALSAGANVVITSGLLCALQREARDLPPERRISQITEMRCTGRELPVDSYPSDPDDAVGAWHNADGGPAMFPLISFFTNESWSLVHGLDHGFAVPLLLMDQYSRGTLYVWVMPENPADLYRLPAPVLAAIKKPLAGALPVRLDGPSGISIFPYNNGTFIVESFLPHPAAITITGRFHRLENLVTGAVYLGRSAPASMGPSPMAGRKEEVFPFAVEPHSWIALRER